MPSTDASRLQKLWLAVQTKPEHATTEFWEDSLPSQQPPTDDVDDLRRVDLLVRKIDDDTILLFLEAKRANATRDQIEVVEYQAFTACCAHLFQTQKPAIWAMTCVGSKARIWAYKWNDDYVTPILPLGDELSEIGQYAEYSTHSKELVEALKHVKKNPIPDKATFENPQSPRPLSATLPDGWHDREVAFMSSATSYQAEADPGTALLQLPRSGCVRQAQAADTYQGMLDPNQSYEITVERFENRVYQCLRVVDGARVNVPEGGWGQCTILSSETLYPCYSWVGESGTQYFAWSLGSEEARGQ